MKKKLFCLMLSAALVLSMFTGCGDDEDVDVNDDKVSTESSGFGSGSSVSSDESEEDYYEEDDSYSEEDDSYSEDDEAYADGGFPEEEPDYKYDYSDIDIASDTTIIEGTNDKASKEEDAANVTVMVYMCGADLESEGGAATADINEMLYADRTGDKLNIILQTGGAKEWQNSVISSDSVQRYVVEGEDGLKLVDDIGQKKMTDATQLGDFIAYSAKNYPADRYILIFWDHGGGTMGGYGVDENFNGEGMDISQIRKGIENGGVHFDMIGFDCCLMGTVEIANGLSSYADFLVASEETEPGCGWYYTNFMSELDNNPGLSMRSLGKRIIRDFVSTTYTDDDTTTLALIDLSKIGNVTDALDGYMKNAADMLSTSNAYGQFAQARSNARSYGEDGFEQIDMTDYVTRTSVEGANELTDAIRDAVVYSAARVPNSYGLAMYHPYLATEAYNEVSKLIENMGITGQYYNQFFNDFVSIEMKGQSGGGDANPYGADTSQEQYNYENEGWYNGNVANEYDYNYMDSSELEITEKGDGFVLKLSDDDWELVTNVQLLVYVDDGEGYLALGADDVYEFDDDGDLKIDFDYNWLYFDDCVVPYYAESYETDKDGNTLYSLGYVPAVINNDQDIRIWIKWTNDGVKMLGYTPDYDNATAAKGYMQFKDGDVIDFYFDYYDYDGNYDDAYMLNNNTIKYSSKKPFEIGYADIGEVNTQICFYLKDIYQNEYWTESVDLYY